MADHRDDDWFRDLERFAGWVWNAAMRLALLAGFPFMLLAGVARKVYDLGRDLVARITPEDPLRLRVYGETLLTERVKLELGAFTALLLAQFAFDLWAWSNAWSYAGTTAVTITMLSMVFATVILIVDRAIIVVDVSQVRSKLGLAFTRGALLILLACITAVPVELRIFQPEIEQVIANEEKVAVDAIREKAKAYETELATRQKDTTAAALTGSPDAVVQRRAQEREAIVAQQKSDRADITKRLSAKSTELVRETAGKGPSGRRGDGVTTAAMRKQEADIRKELSDFDKAAREQLREFDRETERMRTEAVKSGTDELSRRDTALDEKLHAVEAMPAAELAAAYGGEWQKSRGFLERYRTLLDLIDADPKNSLIAWGCRLIMIVLGLTILFAKPVMSSDETVAYFSLMAQAAGGNERAKKLVKLQGYGVNDRVHKLGWTQEVQRLHERMSQAQIAVRNAVTAFEAEMERLCEPPGDGLCLSRDRLEIDAGRAWLASVQPKVDALEAVEAQFERFGVDIPAWPTDWTVRDPRRSGERPWNLGDAELNVRYGWVNPQEAIRRITSARHIARAWMSELGPLLEEMENQTLRLIHENPEAEIEEIEHDRRQFVLTRLNPVVNELSEALAALQAARQPVPPWPEALGDAKKRREVWRANLDVLEDYGWKRRLSSGT